MFMGPTAVITAIAVGGMITLGAIVMEPVAVTITRVAFGFRFRLAIVTEWVAVISTRADIGCRMRDIIIPMASVAGIITTIVFGGIIRGCILISMDADIITIAGCGWTFLHRISIRRAAAIYTMD